ncbi:MAG: hypothetical protein ACLP9S_07555 [Syntrophales bacterium]
MSNQVIKFISLVLASSLLAGCVNPFEKYYNGTTDARVVPRYDTSYVVPGGHIPIYTTEDPDKDLRALRIKGFDIIGVSSFYAPDKKVTLDQAQSMGQKIGAHVILLKSHYKDTVSGAVPLVLPKNSTSYTTGTASAYGTGGSATAYGSSTTTTYGTQTTMIPYSVSRSDFLAVFLAKSKQRVGMYPKALSDEERKALNTNSAVKVDYVVEDTPAFIANVFPGDFLVGIDDDPVTSPDSYLKLLTKYEGRDPKFHFVRDGKPLDKVIHVNAVTPIESQQSPK